MLTLVIVTVATRFGGTFDDPLITLRYAHNVVAGHGPVFNPGQRVEGFTSPLHLVLATVVQVLPGGTKLLLLKIASAVFACLLGHRSLLLMRRIALPDWAQLFAIVLIGANWVIARMGSDGLETTLSVWLLVWLLDLLVSKDAFRKPVKAAIVGALAAAARPENLLFIAALWVVALIFEREVRPVRRIVWGIGPACITVAITIGRRWYYGEWLPNTYFAKKLPLYEATHEGIQFLQSTVSTQVGKVLHGPIPLIVAAAVLVVLCAAILEMRTRRNWAPTLGYAAALIGANLAFVLESGGGIGSGGPRFLTPSVVPIALIVTMGVAALVRRARLTRKTSVLVAGVIAIVSVIPLTQTHSVIVLRDGVSDSQLIENGGHVESHMWATLPRLTACAPAGSTIAATEVGLLGASHTDLDVTDMRGLTNSYIAHHSVVANRHVWGVWDPNWYEASSVVGHELKRTRPVLIITFDPIPHGRTVLDGTYRKVATHVVGRFPIRSFALVGGPCDQPRS